VLNPFRREEIKSDLSFDQIPPMMQTEDQISGLTRVIEALLRLYRHPLHADEIAARTGDCFALGLSPDTPTIGLCSPGETFLEALADVGIVAKPVSHAAEDGQLTRMFTQLRAGMRHLRPAIACGGWRPRLPGKAVGYTWGIVHRFAPDTAEFHGSAVQDALVHRTPSQNLIWPADPTTLRSVLLIEGRQAPRWRPGKLVRRALTRAVALLSGEQGGAGVDDYTRLIDWLGRAELDPAHPAGDYYPFPMMVAIRAQFEQMARYLTRVTRLIPPPVRAHHARALELSSRAAELLLSAEPQRIVPRASGHQDIPGQLPWPADAWRQMAPVLAQPGSIVRQDQTMLVKELREIHGQLVEALHLLVTE